MPTHCKTNNKATRALRFYAGILHWLQNPQEEMEKELPSNIFNPDGNSIRARKKQAVYIESNCIMEEITQISNTQTDHNTTTSTVTKNHSQNNLNHPK
eukprot:3684424-Ditylum_brightwellii.AAC.1